MPIAGSSHSKRSGNKARITWTMTGEQENRKSRSKNCKTINWEVGSMMSTTKVNYFTAYEHCHLIIKFLDVPSTETAQPY